jgi:hypothetical protein
MKTIVLILMSLIPCCVAGQSITEWNNKTDSLIQTLPNVPNQFRFNEIVDNRKNYKLKAIFDTTFQVLRIQEMFDVHTNKFDQNIDYWDNADANVLSEEWAYKPIDSIRPRNYVMYLGCIFKKNQPRKVKRWKRKIEKMDPVRETYYIVDTILDKRTGMMKISLRIPVLGDRELEAFGGPFGKSRKPFLTGWWN